VTVAVKQVDLLCSIEGCGKKRLARGWCSAHYDFWYKYGDPLAPKQRREPGSGTLHGGYVRHGSGGRLIREHQLIAERALGKPLPKGAQVHHWDENKSNNSPENLVVCPSDAYHKLLHQRQRALNACGNANYRKCQFCKKWSDPETMKLDVVHGTFYHFECRQTYNFEYQAARKAAK
jgi:hypothetical protein